nr:SRPBCC family protein [Pelomonas sp. P8]
MDAPPQVVFAAWTDPAALLQWWCPGPAHATHAELDVRAGGRYEIRMTAGPGGEPQVVSGEYVAVEPPHRLVMTWHARGTPHDNGDASLLTVELHPHPRGTRLALLHERLPTGSGASYSGGWAAVLQALSRFVQPPSAA